MGPITLGSASNPHRYPSPGYRTPLLSGDGGIAQTIGVMRRLIDGALHDAGFVRFAIEIVRRVPAHDAEGEVEAIYHWVLSTIRFVRDPVDKERLYPPQEILKVQAGDCDDISMLMSALLMAVGYPARLVTVAALPQAPEAFSHVYVEAEVPPGSGQWVALDAARVGAAFGVQPRTCFRKKIWSLTSGRDQEVDCEETMPSTTLAGYLGDDSGDGIDWGSILQQTIQTTPQIVAVATGQPSTVKLPGGAVTSTGNPYGSFATPYTPGYGIPPAGYSLQTASSTLFSSALPWIAVVIAAVFAFRGRH